jgi:hypothetical protein
MACFDLQAAAALVVAYDQDMLDPEWQAMLGLVDDSLLEVWCPVRVRSNPCGLDICLLFHHGS